MSQEIFYPIKDFENYLISNNGRIKNIKTNRFLKGCKNNKNVDIVNLYKDKKMFNTTIFKIMRDNNIATAYIKTSSNYIKIDDQGGVNISTDKYIIEL